VGEAAELLGVSADTVRRWTDGGRLRGRRTPSGRRRIERASVARLATALASSPGVARQGGQTSQVSARNRFPGIVTKVVRDRVMAQVEVQAGRHRLVALISREAADQLRLAPGARVTASVKATNVLIALDERR